MTITELRYIIALAKEQHFGKAAKSVHVSQPTLSLGIKKLETELEIDIFERLSNKVIPTSIGKDIINEAKKTLMRIDLIKSMAKDSKSSLSGQINLGAIFTICPYLLPKIIPEISSRAPNLKVFIDENYTNNLINKLKEGIIDLAILSLPIESSDFLEIEELFEEEFFVIMSKEDNLAKKHNISAKDLDKKDVFLLGGGNCFRDQVLYACPQAAPDAINSEKLIGGSLETIRLMVKSNLGVSIFPKMAILDSDTTIAVKKFCNPIPKRKIVLCWRKSFLQKEVINVIKESIISCNPGRAVN